MTALGFVVEKEDIDSLKIAVPYHKPDISLPADIVEEILRIDGLDNVSIPTSITMTPAVEENRDAEVLKEKAANYLAGLGFNETLTNSITNKAYFSEAELAGVVKMKNSLSAELNIMRPKMLETGLEVLAHNLNRRNENLRLFEYGKPMPLIIKAGLRNRSIFVFILQAKNRQMHGKEKAPRMIFIPSREPLKRYWHWRALPGLVLMRPIMHSYNMA